MAGSHGKDLFLEFGGTALNTDFRSFSPSESIELIEDTAGSDAAKSFITGVKDGNATATIIRQDDSGTTTWAAVSVGTSDTLVWGDQGSTSGKAKHSVRAIVQDRSKDFDFGDVVACNVTFQFNAEAVTDTTFA